MNLDNQRLKEIKEQLSIYYYELKKADTISDCLNIKKNIDLLEKEEQEILERFDVII